MYVPHDAPAAFPLSSRIQALFATLAHAVKIMWADDNAAQSDAPDSGLERHLRYDIGEIDGDPRRTRSLDNPGSHEPDIWRNQWIGRP